MKILQISHTHHIRGGSDAVYFATSQMLEHAGHTVIPFCMDHPDNEDSRWSAYFPKGADTGAPRLRDTARYFYNGDARKKLKRLLDEVGPVDLAHLHIYHGKQTPAILPILRARGIPILQSLHEYKLACPVYTMQRGNQPCDRCLSGGPLHCITNRCKDGSLLKSTVMAAEFLASRLQGDVRLVDRFLCVSDFQRQQMQRAGIPAEKLFTLHNFVASTGETPAQTHDNYLLYFGRLEELKGLGTLLTALENSKQHLLIAGDGSWRDQMLERIQHMPNVDYLGFCSGSRLHRLIQRAKAVVVPSEWYENCPMSVLEAFSHGRPVIGARIGGIPELIRDGQNGFLFTPGQPGALKHCFDRLDTTEFSRLSQQAHDTAMHRFSPDTYQTDLIKHYAALQGQRRDFVAQPA
ncbi:MAG: glycosyltransferase family 4 protein [Marinosulfonomonas sp.]